LKSWNYESSSESRFSLKGKRPFSFPAKIASLQGGLTWARSKDSFQDHPIQVFPCSEKNPDQKSRILYEKDGFDEADQSENIRSGICD
jgi:hypothetical protein